MDKEAFNIKYKKGDKIYKEVVIADNIFHALESFYFYREYDHIIKIETYSGV